jgi:hypothetical protein
MGGVSNILLSAFLLTPSCHCSVHFLPPLLSPGATPRSVEQGNIVGSLSFPASRFRYHPLRDTCPTSVQRCPTKLTPDRRPRSKSTTTP